MVKFFRRSAKQLRQPIVCLSAFTAGCLFAATGDAASPWGVQQFETSGFAPLVADVRLDTPLVSSLPVYGNATAQPGTHRLQNVEVSVFESNVLDTWGGRLKTSLSPDGRYVRVEMPTRVHARMAMLIDRENGTVSFEGDDSLRNNWSEIVRGLDSLPQRRPDGSVIQTVLLDGNRAEIATVEQAAFLMGMLQDDQDDDPVPGEISEQLPAGTIGLGDAQLPGNLQIPDGMGIQGPVKIVQDPQTGIITIVGAPKDVAIIKKIILAVSEEAKNKQPVVTRIPLANLQSDVIAEQIQEIYDGSYAAVNGAALIEPLASPNSLVVVGQPLAIEAVRKIVEEMDSPPGMDEAAGFKAFQLEFMSAVDAKTRLDTYFNRANLLAGDNQPPSAPVITVSDFRSNTIIVKGTAQFIKEAEDLLKVLDVDTTGAMKEVKVIPLKNTLAEDIAVVIQDAINGQQANSGQGFNPNNQAQQQQNLNNQQPSPNQSQLGSQRLSLTAINADGRKVVKESGIMFGVRITADRNSNSLVVTASKASMELVEALVEQLDRVPDAETLIKVFKIVNGDAEALLTMFETLFGAGGNQGQQQQPGGNLTQLPLQNASATDGATLVNLRFSADPRSNTIIASGPAGDLQVVEDLLLRLDVKNVNTRTTTVYRLSNAPALDVAEAINQYLDPRNDIIVNDPRTLGGISQSQRTVIVVPEVVTNSLIVSSLPEYRVELDEIIKSLDRRPSMVKVKVLIAQVDLTELEELGIEVGVQDSLLFDRGTTLGAGGNIVSGIGFPFNGPAQANENAISPGNLATQALSYFGTGRINSALGYGGFVFSAGNESVDILVRALENKQCIKILSKPEIVTIANLQGRVSVGENVPRLGAVVSDGFGQNRQSVDYVDIGILLEITPRVSPDGMIVMKVDVRKSRLGREEDGVTVGFSNSDSDTPLKVAKILETEANTTLMARSGQTVVFAGLIQETKINIHRGVPYLSDLPGIGPLFSYDSDANERKELLIIMTPYLITDDEDMMAVNNDSMDRMHWCLSDVAEIYGKSDYDGGPEERNRVETFYPDSDPTGAAPSAQGQEEFDIPVPQQPGSSRLPVGQRSSRSPVGGANQTQRISYGIK